MFGHILRVNKYGFYKNDESNNRIKIKKLLLHLVQYSFVHSSRNQVKRGSREKKKKKVKRRSCKYIFSYQLKNLTIWQKVKKLCNNA